MNGLTCTISIGNVFFFNPYKWSYAALLITGDGKKFIKRYPNNEDSSFLDGPANDVREIHRS